LRPRSVEKLKIGREVIPDGVVSGVLGLAMIWVLALALGTLVLLCDRRLDMVSAFSACVSALGNVGPAITPLIERLGDAVPANAGGIDLGPFGSFGPLSWWAKILLAFYMVLGRLEILTALAVLSPSFWSRS
jgi:trk system potassium uptake protein TrkH